MAAPDTIGLYTRQAGVWERVAPPHVKAAGVWEEVQTVWTKESAVWREVWVDPAGELSIVGQIVIAFDFFGGGGHDSHAIYRLKSNGVAQRETIKDGGAPSTTDIASQWKRFQLDRDFECKWTDTSSSGGASFTPPFAEDTWTALSSDRTFRLSDAFEGESSQVFDVFIREVGGTETDGLISAQITLNIENG